MGNGRGISLPKIVLGKMILFAGVMPGVPGHFSRCVCGVGAYECKVFFVNGCLVDAAVRRRTRDRKVAGSTPGRGTIKSDLPTPEGWKAELT